jgi:hypothetical protein
MNHCSPLRLYMENAVFHAVLTVVEKNGELDDAQAIIIHAYSQLHVLQKQWRLLPRAVTAQPESPWVDMGGVTGDEGMRGDKGNENDKEIDDEGDEEMDNESDKEMENKDNEEMNEDSEEMVDEENEDDEGDEEMENEYNEETDNVGDKEMDDEGDIEMDTEENEEVTENEDDEEMAGGVDDKRVGNREGKGQGEETVQRSPVSHPVSIFTPASSCCPEEENQEHQLHNGLMEMPQDESRDIPHWCRGQGLQPNCGCKAIKNPSSCSFAKS